MKKKDRFQGVRLRRRLVSRFERLTEVWLSNRSIRKEAEERGCRISTSWIIGCVLGNALINLEQLSAMEAATSVFEMEHREIIAMYESLVSKQRGK